MHAKNKKNRRATGFLVALRVKSIDNGFRRNSNFRNYLTRRYTLFVVFTGIRILKLLECRRYRNSGVKEWNYEMTECRKI